MSSCISILGSTGSIGRQTLDVAEKLGIQIAALTANRDIEKLEAQLAALDAESEANATDYQKLMELDAQKQTLNTQLEALYEAWEALCD